MMTNKTWDTMLNWIINTGKTIEAGMMDTRTWGNYSNSESPANVERYGEKQKVGYSDKWSKCNIYDVAGNVWEWTADKYDSSSHARRGGYCPGSGSNISAVCRNSITETIPDNSRWFSFSALCNGLI